MIQALHQALRPLLPGEPIESGLTESEQQQAVEFAQGRYASITAVR